jgi:hypothetical protein
MSDAHQSLDIERVRRDLHVLVQHVVRNWGRIEVSASDDGDGKDGCVLISKAELAAMERALEILCELPGGRAICEELTQVARLSTPLSLGAIAAADGGGSASSSTGDAQY